MLMKHGGMMFRDFFIEKLHNLLCFCVHFAQNFANHALSEMILLKGLLLMLVVEYRGLCARYPLPLNIYEKLHNLVHLCYVLYTGRKFK